MHIDYFIMKLNEEIRVMRNTKIRCFIIFILFFSIYLFIGVIFSHQYQTYPANDFFFNADTLRVYDNMAIFDANHYRTKVHPLFVILLQPLILTINIMISAPIESILIIQSIAGSFSIFLVYYILKKAEVSKVFCSILCGIYGFSFTSLIFTSIPETFIFSGFLLLLLWAYVIKLYKSEDDINQIQKLGLICLGILSISVTVTNFLQFIIAVFFLYLQKKNNNNTLFVLNKTCFTCLLSFLFSAYLANIQYYIWRTSSPFLANLISLFTSTSNEEYLYMNFQLTLENFNNLLQSFWGTNIISAKPYLSDNGLIFSSLNVISIFMGIVMIILFSYTFIKTASRTSEYKYYVISLGMALLSNLCLHLIYGNSIIFLYSQHFTFLIILIIGMGSNFLSAKQKNVVSVLLICYLIVEIVFNIFSLSIIRRIIALHFLPKYARIFFVYIKVLAKSFIVIIPLLSVLYLIAVKKFKHLFLCCMMLTLIPVAKRQYEISQFSNSLGEEYIQYKEYSDEYQRFIKNYKAKKIKASNSDFFFFGMGNRDKFLYQNGDFINVETGELLYHWDVAHELVIPNEYTVILQDKRQNKIIISEDEHRVKILDGAAEIQVPNTNSPISLPDFRDYEYPNIMKVLHHEVLINIKNGVPVPNFIVYDDCWYRDAMMMGMVLKSTDNLELIKNYIVNLEDYYDELNGMMEADNLGQVLYLISLVSDKNHPLVNEILAEVKRIQIVDDNGLYLNGMTDFSNQSIYQTSCLKLGLNALGIEDNYTVVNDDSTYRSLVWWDKNVDSSGNYLDFKDFPYLNWACYHKTEEGNLYLGSTLYPLTWEQHATSANYEKMWLFKSGYYSVNKMSPTHGWMASEILLYLLDFKAK